jgi:hypothetical protein
VNDIKTTSATPKTENAAKKFINDRRSFLQGAMQGAVATAGFGLASAVHVSCATEAEAETPATAVRMPRATTLSELHAKGYFGDEFKDAAVTDTIKGLTLGQLDECSLHHSKSTTGGKDHFGELKMTEADTQVIQHLFALSNQAAVKNLASAGGLNMEVGFNTAYAADTSVTCCCCCCPCCSCCYAATDTPAKPSR